MFLILVFSSNEYSLLQTSVIEAKLGSGAGKTFNVLRNKLSYLSL